VYNNTVWAGKRRVTLHKVILIICHDCNVNPAEEERRETAEKKPRKKR